MFQYKNVWKKAAAWDVYSKVRQTSSEIWRWQLLQMVNIVKTLVAQLTVTTLTWCIRSRCWRKLFCSIGVVFFLYNKCTRYGVWLIAGVVIVWTSNRHESSWKSTAVIKIIRNENGRVMQKYWKFLLLRRRTSATLPHYSNKGEISLHN